ETEGLSMAELAGIPGSGREGRITKQDVLGYLKQRTERPAKEAAPARPAVQRGAAASPSATRPSAQAGERVEVVEMDRMRQIIAEHMVRSKATSPHVTSFAEADVTNLVRARELNKAAFMEREGVKLTFTPFFVHAAVEALREHPVLNSSVDGNRILVKKDYHIGIAVALENAGLIVPVIRDAGQKNLVGLAHAAADLAHRARTKALQPDDLSGGTFTVTNVGSLGSIMGTPIISQPQVAILATGAIKKRPVVIEDPALGDVIAVRQMMYLSLSYDHRIIDGAMGVSFLRKFVEVIEGIDPEMEV
ncbi:MAG: dihydrolipoamide acetyltransferase family protein, partial [Rhodothermales bacterium]|nr:dihydrolipoamide acetyltransferase family protein [Rhodothermales bacterium]